MIVTVMGPQRLDNLICNLAHTVLLEIFSDRNINIYFITCNWVKLTTFHIFAVVCNFIVSFHSRQKCVDTNIHD